MYHWQLNNSPKLITESIPSSYHNYDRAVVDSIYEKLEDPGYIPTSALFRSAVYFHDIVLLRKLLARDVREEEVGASILGAVIETANAEIVRLLLEKGWEIKPYVLNAIIHKIEYGQVRQLLAQGAQFDDRTRKFFREKWNEEL